MQAQKYLIVLAGPTAVGKTQVSIQLAKHYNCPILSADSRQFYKEMAIGTAKVTQAEQQEVPHYFIDSLSIQQAYSVGDYEKEALQTLKHIYQTHDVALLCGGSGLFIRALCEGLDKFPEVPSSILEALEEQLTTQGIGALQQELKLADPTYFEQVDQHNPRRLLRALAVCRVSGQPYSSFRKQIKSERFFSPIYILLDMDREQLYQRINERVDQMMKQGLLEEAQRLYPQHHLKALQTVGYQELFNYLAGKQNLGEAIKLIKRNTRRYAKRQLTWFRQDKYWTTFAPSQSREIIAFIDGQLT